MKKIILSAAAAMLVITAGAQTTSPVMPYENYIQVTGRAEKEIIPDEIYVSIVINESEMKQKQTVEKLEKNMIAMLKSLGVDTEKDLRIDNMSSGYQDYLFAKNTARTTAAYQLKVGSSQMLGRVYQGLESLGISNMNIVKLSHTKIKEYQDEVRGDAMKNAQHVARTLAEAVGQKAGRAIYIVDYNSDFTVPVAQTRSNMTYKSYAAADEMYETELDFRDIKLNYSLTVKFELE